MKTVILFLPFLLVQLAAAQSPPGSCYQLVDKFTGPVCTFQGPAVNREFGCTAKDGSNYYIDWNITANTSTLSHLAKDHGFGAWAAELTLPGYFWQQGYPSFYETFNNDNGEWSDINSVEIQGNSIMSCNSAHGCCRGNPCTLPPGETMQWDFASRSFRFQVNKNQFAETSFNWVNSTFGQVSWWFWSYKGTYEGNYSILPC